MTPLFLFVLYCNNFNFQLNSLPNDKILDWSKLKALADDNINLAEKLKFVLERVENIAGKGENFRLSLT